jgi:hypothetical protein
MPSIPQPAARNVASEDGDALHLAVTAALGPQVVDERRLPGIAVGARGRGLGRIPGGRA